MKNESQQAEQKHLDVITDEIKQAETKTEAKIESVKSDTETLHRDFFDDVKVNFSTASETLETALSIQQQQQMLMERNNDWQNSTQRLDVLKRLEKNPYFARIDFKEKPENPDESIYIGLGSFTNDDNQFLIYDWRAPISSIYYDGGIGQVTYQTPDGPQTVKVDLKRQFLINDGKITSMFDTQETIGDQMLLEVLGEKSSAQMKSIVTTIQREQNKIIRDTDSELLFVQGAAGSGKTSAILQRVAYLLYRYRGNLTSNQVIMFSPNQLFNDYISDVLPELGEQNMVQMTFYQYASHRLPNIQVETLYSQFETTLTPDQQKISKLKTSLAFFNATKRYATHLEKEGMKFRDINYAQGTFADKEKVKDIYYSFNENYHLGNRLEATKERLLKMLNRRVSSEMKKSWVSEQVESLSDDQMSAMRNGQTKNFASSDAEFNYYAKKIVTKTLQSVNQAIRRNRFISIKNQYIAFLHAIPQLIDIKKWGLTNEAWQKGIEDTVNQLQSKQMVMDDVAPYLHLYDLISGKHGDLNMRFVFIDEIQDYTPYQLAFIKAQFPRAKYTLLGDLNQAIFTKENSSSLLGQIQKLFDPEHTEVIQLTHSYRSTEQITDFTKDILKSGQVIKAFDRDGDKPNIILTNSKEAELGALADQLKQNEAAHYTTAIITKTMEEAEKLAAELKAKSIQATLIKSENQRLVEGTIIVPSYLAKGLEFDAVIAYNVSKGNYHEEDERTLVYTIASRAMHRLTILAAKELSPLLDQVDPKTYVLKQG